MTEDFKRAEAHHWYEDEKNVWFSLYRKNAICVYKKENETLRILGNIPGEPCLREELTTRVIKLDNQLLFVPNCSWIAPVLNIETREIVYIDLLKNKQLSKYVDHEPLVFYGTEYGMMNFWEGTAYNGAFWVFGFRIPVVVKINANSYEVTCFDFSEKGNDVINFGIGFHQEKNRVVLPCGGSSRLFSFDMETEKGEFINVPVKSDGFMTLAYENETYWLCGLWEDQSLIVSWDVRRNRIKKIKLPELALWWPPFIENDEVYLFPLLYPNHILKINKEKLSYEIFEELDELLNEEETTVITGIDYRDHKVVFLRNSDHRFCSYDLKKRKKAVKTYLIPEGDFFEACVKEFYDRIFESGKQTYIFSENDLPLGEFIKRI